MVLLSPSLKMDACALPVVHEQYQSPDVVLLFFGCELQREQDHVVCVSVVRFLICGAGMLKIIWKSCTESSSWLVQQMDSCSVQMIWRRAPCCVRVASHGAWKDPCYIAESPRNRAAALQTWHTVSLMNQLLGREGKL